MTAQERIGCIREAWENAEKTTHDYLTTSEKREVETLLDMVEDLIMEVCV